MPINAELTFSSHSFCTNNLQFFHLFSGVMVDDFGSNYFIRFKNLLLQIVYVAMWLCVQGHDLESVTWVQPITIPSDLS